MNQRHTSSSTGHHDSAHVVRGSTSPLATTTEISERHGDQRQRRVRADVRGDAHDLLGAQPRELRARARRFGSGLPPERSIFGARLRTRCPQYGHSVTYGLTSDPQFLQTTKRSG